MNTYVMLVGNSNVGKTTMAAHLHDHSAPQLTQVTVSPEFVALTVPVGAGETPLKLTLIDAPGPSNFAGLVASYYRGAEGIILMYDVTQRSTFEALKTRWMPEIVLRATSLRCVVVVANQCDKPLVVTHEEGRKFAESIKAKGFFALSALKGTFESIITPLSVVLREIVDQRKAANMLLPPADPTATPIRLEGETVPVVNNKSCC